MERFRQLYYILFSVFFALTACQSDMTDETALPESNGVVSVKINVSPASHKTTRAVGDWEDKIAADEEMMNLWTVVILNSTNSKIVEIHTCKPTEEHRERDEFTTDLPPTLYTICSFANISASNLDKILGLPDGTVPKPEPGADGVVISKKMDIKPQKTLTDIITKSVGNNFDLNEEDNGFGCKGIPMSNMQTAISVNDNTEKINLVVVRMLAKMELQVYNDRGTDVTIESITLTDITKNGDGFLYLFPNYQSGNSGSSAGANTMEAKHGDIQPNLTNTATTGDFKIINFENNGVVSATDNSYAAGKEPVKIVFYINESKTPVNTPTDFGHFFLKIQLEDEDEERYVLIDDRGKTVNDKGETVADDKKWNYIARNDYRIIPIVLDDYKLDIIPYDFPAIGVHPASVKEEDGIYTINFHDYGHFHLLPKVTKYSNGAIVPYDAPITTGTDKTYWTLADNDFSQAWTSWTDATKATSYNNDNNATGGFYRRNNNDTKDADEAGGEPVWYENTGSPIWSPDGVYKGPFIFGYIADPEGELNGDKKVYHEFSINLYKNGTGAARQMTYRLYMILDQNQMIYRTRSLGNPTPRHTH